METRILSQSTYHPGVVRNRPFTYCSYFTRSISFRVSSPRKTWYCKKPHPPVLLMRHNINKILSFKQYNIKVNWSYRIRLSRGVPGVLKVFQTLGQRTRSPIVQFGNRVKSGRSFLHHDRVLVRIRSSKVATYDLLYAFFTRPSLESLKTRDFKIR